MALRWILGAMLLIACDQVCGKHTAEDEELLIGWKGEVPSLSSHKPGDDSWIEQISWEPRAYVWHHMLTKKQCDKIIKIATPRLAKSKVVDSGTGKEADDPIRTSYGATVTGRDDEALLKEIDDKIAQLAMLPPENSEQLQVLRYENGQKYDAHWDQFDNPVVHKEFFANGGQRVATALLYLSDVQEGGETVFPKSNKYIHPPGQEARRRLSPCGTQGIAVKPSAGDVLFFWGVLPDGTTDKHAMHAGCPVLRGTKFTATMWIHAKEYNQGALQNPQLKPGECRDLNEQCKLWAELGECENNPDFMKGIDTSEGQCGWSCNSCKPKPEVRVRQSMTVGTDLSQVTWRRRAY